MKKPITQQDVQEAMTVLIESGIDPSVENIRIFLLGKVQAFIDIYFDELNSQVDNALVDADESVDGRSN
jgi:hypothetical protein